MQIVYGPQLNVKKVPHLTMTVGVVTDAVKLKVDITQTGLGCLTAEFLAFCKLNAVGCRLYRVVANLA